MFRSRKASLLFLVTLQILLGCKQRPLSSGGDDGTARKALGNLKIVITPDRKVIHVVYPGEKIKWMSMDRTVPPFWIHLEKPGLCEGAITSIKVTPGYPGSCLVDKNAKDKVYRYEIRKDPPPVKGDYSNFDDSCESCQIVTHCDGCIDGSDTGRVNHPAEALPGGGTSSRAESQTSRTHGAPKPRAKLLPSKASKSDFQGS